MNFFRIYINYIAGSDEHAGVYVNNHVYYIRFHGSGTAYPLTGFVDVSVRGYPKS